MILIKFNNIFRLYYLLDQNWMHKSSQNKGRLHEFSTW